MIHSNYKRADIKDLGFWCLPLMYFIKIISVTAGGDSILREIFLDTLTAASQTTATDSPKTTCDDHQQLLIELKHNEDRVGGGFCRRPLTPPDMRFRIRRFS